MRASSWRCCSTVPTRILASKPILVCQYANGTNFDGKLGDPFMMDGAAIPAASFVPIGTSGFSAAQVPITVGSHTLTSNKPLGVYVYGFNSSDSYGDPGGSRL